LIIIAILDGMKCPDCKGSLVEVTLSGIDKSFRCFRCGGIWIKDNTLIELSIKALEGWKPIVFENSILLAGDNRCPLDDIELKKFISSKISENWNVRKCERCMNWWWPTDTLFRVKNVVQNNNGYLRVKEAIANEVS